MSRCSGCITGRGERSASGGFRVPTDFIGDFFCSPTDFTDYTDIIGLFEARIEKKICEICEICGKK